jgi:hypothetical protein
MSAFANAGAMGEGDTDEELMRKAQEMQERGKAKAESLDKYVAMRTSVGMSWAWGGMHRGRTRLTISSLPLALSRSLSRAGTTKPPRTRRRGG